MVSDSRIHTRPKKKQLVGRDQRVPPIRVDSRYGFDFAHHKFRWPVTPYPIFVSVRVWIRLSLTPSFRGQQTVEALKSLSVLLSPRKRRLDGDGETNDLFRAARLFG